MKRIKWTSQTVCRVTGAAMLAGPFLFLSFTVAYSCWGFPATAEIDLDHRIAQCGLGNLVLTTGLAGVAVFLGLLLLYCGQIKQRLIGYLLIPSGVFFFAALFLLYVWASSYFSRA